jgi:hypothetical protein
MRTCPTRRLAAWFLLVATAFLPAAAKAEVKRAVLFGEVEVPKASLFGEDHFALRLGLHSYKLDDRGSTSPAFMAGISWRGTIAPALPEGPAKGAFLDPWDVDGRLSAQFYDAPEGPAGAALDLSGDVLFRRRFGISEPYFGPSLRYGILRMDRFTSLDNGAAVKSTTSVTTSSFRHMVGIVAGVDIFLSKHLLLRPEVRVALDPSIFACLVYLPYPSTPGGKPAGPTDASAVPTQSLEGPIPTSVPAALPPPEEEGVSSPPPPPGDTGK